MNRKELQWLAKERLVEAKALLDAGRWSGAYYLAGYAVECALKACIAKQAKAEEFPDRAFADKCWTHDLERLVSLANLRTDLDAAKTLDQDFQDNWDVVKDWSEASRYERTSKAAAWQLFRAITNSKHGVFPWIRFRW